MENNQSASGLSLTYATAILVLTVILWRVVDLLWLRPKKLERRLREQGFKGNPYKPLLGDALLLLKQIKVALSKPISLSDDTLPRVLPFVLHILNKHGNNSFGWIATTPWLIVTDVDKIKEVLNNYEDFRKPNRPFTKLLLVGVFGLEGEKWAKHRKIINPAFHLEKLKDSMTRKLIGAGERNDGLYFFRGVPKVRALAVDGNSSMDMWHTRLGHPLKTVLKFIPNNMLPAMNLSCRNMTDLWEEKVSKEGSTELDVWPFIENLTADVISRAAFGSSYEEGREIFNLQTEHLNLSTQMLQSNYIPGLRFVPTKKNQKMKAVSKEIVALLMGIIEKRKIEVERGGSNKDDLLGILLESSSREIQENGNAKGKGLTTEEVVQECKLFYLAGQETTSSLLAWCLVLLSQHQDWQERARTEILQVFGHDQKPNFDGLSQLKVVSMILNETLRLYTPAYMLLRKVFEDTKLGEWLIPAGTEVAIPLSVLHQNFDIWGNDAKEFKPERFSEGVSKAMKGHGLFMPFSSGPRVCIGLNFALLEAKIALTYILRLFSLQLSPTYVHAPRADITIKPQHGVNLILCKL